MTAWQMTKRSVLVPVDFSTASRRALETARSFVEDPAHIHAIHVVLPPVPAVPALITAGPDPAIYVDPAAKALRTILEEMGLEQAHSEVRVGGPAPTICDYAASQDVELIVMPTHGRKGLGRWFLGSVAERVVRGAPCPVLLLRTKNEDLDE